MIKVGALKVRSLDVDFNQLSWEIENTSEDALDFTFQVLRSESRFGPWDVLSVPFTDRFIFFDRLNQPFHAGRQLHYSLRVTNRLTGETYDTEPVKREPEADLIATELRRHMNLLLREFTGRRCWILPVRTFGQRCTCWNATLQKRTRSGCRACYDTGFARGYLHPIEIFVQMDPGGNLSEQNTNVGPTHQSNTTARLTDIGTVKPRDLLIESENRRWRVVTVNQTEQSRAPVHLELQLHEIPPSDIEYAIELKMDQALKDLWLSPARNFSNPQNLESFRNEEIPGIFSLYNTTYTKPE